LRDLAAEVATGRPRMEAAVAACVFALALLRAGLFLALLFFVLTSRKSVSSPRKLRN
jgi:hypothetical protein